jgi:hypothetical protein
LEPRSVLKPSITAAPQRKNKTSDGFMHGYSLPECSN